MKKLLLLTLLISSPLLGQEKKQAYFQEHEQQLILSVLGTVSANVLFEDNKNVFFEGAGGINLEFYYRFTSPNFFGTIKLKSIFPMRKNNSLSRSDLFAYIGMGGFLLDERDNLGIGSFMTMSFNAFFLPLTGNFGMGASLDTRYHYSFHPKASFTLGFDLEYRVADSRNSTFHDFGIRMSFGFSFNEFKYNFYPLGWNIKPI